MVETDVVKEPMKKLTRIEIVEAMQKMKSGKVSGPSEVSVEMIVANGKIRVEVIMDCASAYWMVEECLMSGRLV